MMLYRATPGLYSINEHPKSVILYIDIKEIGIVCKTSSHVRDYGFVSCFWYRNYLQYKTDQLLTWETVEL